MNFRERGCELTLLHLEHVDQLDMSALCIIAETCPLLRYILTFGTMYFETCPLLRYISQLRHATYSGIQRHVGTMYHSRDMPLMRYLSIVLETCSLLRITLTCHHFIYSLDMLLLSQVYLNMSLLSFIAETCPLLSLLSLCHLYLNMSACCIIVETCQFLR